MQYQEIEAPLFPVLPRPLEERIAPGLILTLVRWVTTDNRRLDEETRLSRYSGGRI